MILRFGTSGSTTRNLEMACLVASEFLSSAEPSKIQEAFRKSIFDMSNVSVDQLWTIKDEMLNMTNPTVYLRKTVNPWSAAVAWINGNDPTRIFLNSRKINRDVPSLVGSLVHEFFHCLEIDANVFRPNVFFNHGDNRPEGKEDTAQYFMGRYAQKWAEEYLHRWEVVATEARNAKVLEAEEILGDSFGYIGLSVMGGKGE